MSQFVVSARKYRPDSFELVVGQQHITNTLKNAIVGNQLAHAFLFCGPRGVGKTTCARILAKAVNCSNLTKSGDPCNVCDSCKSFNEGRSLNIFELDAASNNSVDDIRALTERLRYIPQSGNRSVYIIDEVHMLSTQAFNAFLKTLEEPPDHALFILATTEKHKILSTILSRCQKFDFKRIKIDVIADKLKQIAEAEGIKYEYNALQIIALKADGAMRDGLSIFDQIVNFSQKNITYSIVLENLNILDYDYYFKMVQCIQRQDHTAALLLFNEIIDKGFDSQNCIGGLLEHFRNLIMAQDKQTVGLLEVSENIKNDYLTQSKSLSTTLLLNAFHLCTECEQKIRQATHPRLLVELTLIKLVHLPAVIEIVTNGIEGKEKKKSNDSINQANEPQNTYQQPEKQQVVSNPTKGKTSSASKFKLGSNLEDLDADDEVDDATKKPTIEAVPIDSQQFNNALQQLIQQLEKERPSVASVLQSGQSAVKKNIWELTVDQELSETMVNEERDLIMNFLSTQTNNPTIQLLIKVVESEITTKEAVPLTQAELSRLFETTNPYYKEFQKLFGLELI